MSTLMSETLNDAEIKTPETRAKKILRMTGWSLLGFFFLVFFTVIKLPEDRVKALIDGHISAALAQRGITYSANEGKISFLFGLSYKMKGVKLNFPPPTPPIQIDEIKVSPSLLGLLIGRMGGRVTIENKGGHLNSSVSIRGSQLSGAFEAKKLDLGRLGVLPIAAGIQGTGVIDGKGNLDGDLSNPSSLDGTIAVNLTQLSVDSQSLYGFSIPKISVSDSALDIVFGKGKATLKTVRLGKPGNAAEDIRGTVTGDILLTKTWDSSTLNLKIRFSLAESILKSMMLLDAILGAGKQPDGSYAFNLTGTLSAPMPNPIPPGGG